MMGSMMLFNRKAIHMPTIDSNYSCHILGVQNLYNLYNESYRVHIMPLVINSLRGGDSHTQTHTHVPERSLYT